MKISLNWIKEFVDIPPKYTAKMLADLLTVRTCEVEGFEDQKIKFSNMVVGKVEKVRPHPNADKLRLADTDIGGRVVQIVCGGENVEPGLFVAVALPGAVVKWHGSEVVELKETKIRGEQSVGMICAEEEIGLPEFTPQNGITIADLSCAFRALGFPFAKPGTPLTKALGLDDIVFEIDNKSLTHRPDLWGHYGMAREFAAFLGKKLKPFGGRTPLKKTGGGKAVKVTLAKKHIASRFLSVILTGIKVERSPAWLVKKLEAVGTRPVNNIVDVTNYVMHELGHPLHAFDRETVANDHFVIRFAREGEQIETLDHKKRKLSKEDALVTNGEKALGLAGVMGGLDSEITKKTTAIILEVARWNPILIRKTALRHSLRSDAAQRFEKSLDPEITAIAFHRAVELILKICPSAKIEGPATDAYPGKAKKISVLADTAKVARKIGAYIPEKEMISHLNALGFRAAKAKKGFLKVTVPTFRATKDINIEDDLVEEIARMHGYEKIAPTLPELPIKLPSENRERSFKHKARTLLSLGLGFTEAYHYSFYGRPEIAKSLVPEEAHVMLENPLTADQTHLRVSLLPNLLKSVALNLTSREELKLYEIGRTYIKTDSYFPREEKFICGVVAEKSGKNGAHEIFYDALGALNAFLERFGAASWTTEAAGTAPPYAHPSKYAAVMISGKEIGIVYEVHPQVLKNFDIKTPCAAFEINFTALTAHGTAERAYRPIPRFPGIEIDVSVLVPYRTSSRSVRELIRHAAGELAVTVSLTDIFEDKSLGEDKKSLTFRILLQSSERTLTDFEMKEAQKRVSDVLQQKKFSIR